MAARYKRPATGSRLIYEVQYTQDMVNWTTIVQGDPNFLLEVDNEDLLRVRSKQPAPPATCFLRVAITHI